MTPPVVDQILDLFRKRGDSEYGGEAVTQEQHALQAALIAERAGATPALIAAALLHDVGHLLHNLPDDAPDHDIDDHHELLAGRWLQRFFPPEVVEPVRLHVPAKRYLCSVDPTYHAGLSEPSKVSLRLQGGPMTPDEAREFEASPHFAAAISLRKFDEAAKDPDMVTPPVSHYSLLLASLALPVSMSGETA
jgi:phosphonate degradation associated HDIG domain protein